MTNFSAEGKPHREQLQAMADDILKNMRNSMTDPKALKTYAESFKIVSALLADELPTENKKADANVDITGFDE